MRCLAVSPDGTIGSWDDNVGSVPDGGREFNSAIYHRGVLYSVGGYEPSWAVSDEAYHARRDSNGDFTSWTTADDLPAGKLTPGLAVIGNRLWVFGGEASEGGGGTDTVYSAPIEDDGDLGDWEEEEDLPFNYAGSASNGEIPVVNNVVYLVGAGSGYDQTWYAPVGADGTVGDWTRGPDKRTRAQVVEANGYIYAFSSWSVATAVPQTVYYLGTPRVKSGGSLDLANLSGGSLTGDASGSAGGSLLAGDVRSLGDLDVRGEANLSGGAIIGGGLTIQGGATLATTSAAALLSVGSENSFGNVLTARADGNVGIGTTTPAQEFVVAGTIQSSDLYGGSTDVTVDANGNLIRDPSDIHLKEEIVPLGATSSLDAVLALRGVSFGWIDDERFGGQREVGFIAQEVQTVIPEAVSDGGEYLSLNTRPIVALLVGAVQAVWARVETLAAAVDSMAAWFADDSKTILVPADGQLCVEGACASSADIKRLIEFSASLPSAPENETADDAEDQAEVDETLAEDDGEPVVTDVEPILPEQDAGAEDSSGEVPEQEAVAEDSSGEVADQGGGDAENDSQGSVEEEVADESGGEEVGQDPATEPEAEPEPSGDVESAPQE